MARNANGAVSLRSVDRLPKGAIPFLLVPSQEATAMVDSVTGLRSSSPITDSQVGPPGNHRGLPPQMQTSSSVVAVRMSFK